MTQTRAYVSSSYPDLVDYRDAARRLLSQHHIDGRGMEDSDYVANPSLYEKCITDAASADLVLLIVGFRYGTRLPQHGDKSLVELEYEAATSAGRDLRAFLLTDQRLPEADDRRGADGGAAIERFRRRLVEDDGRHVAYVTDLADFERKCDKLLVDYRRKLLDQRENHPAARAGNREQLFLETYLRDIIERNKTLEAFYVPLAATTTSAQAARPWHDQMFGEPLMTAAEEVPLEIRLDHVVEALGMHEQFYLAAEPGGGKTLSLIAMETAAAQQYLIDRRRFPLRVDVARWTAEEDFGSFLDRELNERTKVATLPSSQLLLLLDGVLDSAAAGSDPLERIEIWLQRHERCKAILAVRAPRAFSRKLPVVRIAPMDDARIREFVHLRLSSDAEKAATLLTRIGLGDSDRRAGARFATLTSNPFNLSLICDLELRERLPPNAFALLKEVVALKHTKEARKRPRVAWEPFVEAVGAVAMAMIRNRARLTADSAWLRKVMPEGEATSDVLTLAKDCQVMIEHGDGERYEFRHRLYLEYFAAERLRRHRVMLDEVLEEPNYTDGQRVARKFDEVIEALVQIEADPGIIETVAAYDPLLGVRCLRLLAVEDDLGSRAISAVVNGLGSLFTEADAREEAIAKLAGLGAPAVSVLRRLINDSRHFVRRAAVRALSQIPDVQATEAVVLALCDANGWVRDDAQSSIRRFDVKFRELLLQCIRARIDAWLNDPKTEPVVDALVTLIEGLPETQHEFGAAIADAAGIDLETEEGAMPEPVPAMAPPPVKARPVPQEALLVVQDVVGDPDDDVVAEAGPSWGRRWQEEWGVDRGNPALAAAGRAWLSSTWIGDTAWPFVWGALWAARTGPDSDLEWLARDWLARIPRRTRSWPYVWQHVFRESPDEQLTRAGHAWLDDLHVRPERFGWNYVWRVLWEANSRRDELVRSGFWWLETVDAKRVDAWSLVWTRLWDANVDQQRLERIGRAWIEEAEWENPSWGFVWSRLWTAAPDDTGLLALGKEWLEAAPPENGAWFYIWSGVAATGDMPASVEAKARRFVRDQPPESPAWMRVWEPLWKRNRRDPELAALGRTWLAAASPADSAWVALWESLWDATKKDPELTAIGKKAIRKMPTSGALRMVCIHLLAHAHGDPELLELTREMFVNALDDNSHSGFPGLWRVQWDAGADRTWLEPLGRRWVLGVGVQSAAFQQVWQPLWRLSPGETELSEALVTWIRNRGMRRGASQNIASILLEALKSRPGDIELLALARENLLAAPRADRTGSGWVALWRLQWDFGGDREWLGILGRQWLSREGMQSTGFIGVWQRLSANCDASTPSASAELKRLACSWLRTGSNTVAARMSNQNITLMLEDALRMSPADPVLLEVARENLMAAPHSEGKGSGWPTLWRIQWDLGGEREWLEPLGRQWLREDGMESNVFVPLWQRLWADRNADMMNAQSRTAELADIAIQWLRTRGGDFRWGIVAEAVAKAEPRNENLLAVVRTVTAGDASSVRWAQAWRILADAGLLDDDLRRRGVQLLEEQDPKFKVWALVWCGLTQPSPESVARAWELMESTAFDHPLWPEVWEKLWELDPLQRPRLAQAATDWGDVHGDDVHRITRWRKIEALLRADEARSAAVSRIRARMRRFGVWPER